jgi:hypothetical protein
MTTEEKVEDRQAIKQTPIPIFKTQKPSGKPTPEIVKNFGKVPRPTGEKRFPWFGKFGKEEK